MPALTRAARARLRLVDGAFQELHAAKVALFAAHAGVYAALHAQMMDNDGAYELLNTAFDRVARAIATVESATRGKGGLL